MSTTKGEKMGITNDWASVRCDKHDLVSCADCLEASRLRREGSEVRYQNDCGIATFAELTGSDYDFAAEVLGEAGAKLGNGTPVNALRSAFESVGYIVTELPTMTIESAKLASRVGSRKFYVVGSAASGRRLIRGTAHAWTIERGSEARDFLSGYRRVIYRVFEVCE
jgi:hypothetical protein